MTTRFVRTSPTAQVFAVNSTKRAVPDAATLGYISAGQTVTIITQAELDAIPAGDPLPSRAEGTLLTLKTTAPPPRPT